MTPGSLVRIPLPIQPSHLICFRPSKLGVKPDALTRRWDVYPKEGDKGFARVNPQNLRPVFTTEQLTLEAFHHVFSKNIEIKDTLFLQT